MQYTYNVKEFVLWCSHVFFKEASLAALIRESTK